ncbi:MAG: MaoC family dehydratase [Anaerolineales bacterium]|nr:MaoC family dehydratase [Anaerolineales bacterium]MCL4260557.1 MaoC family dehydratase [Anaerolineales bacterium]
MTREFNFKEGDGFSFERFISADDVKKFAEIVGDSNPIHLDESFAERSFFKKRIVHGAFLGGLISKALGVDFPGEGAVYISQNSAFKRPVFVDSIVRVEIKVTQVNSEKRRLALDTTILNADGKACLVGSAEVWLPE